MKKLTIPLMIFGLCVSGLSYSATEKSDVVLKTAISKIRTHTSSHVAPAVQNMTMFWVAGLTDPSCASLYLYSDKDPFLYSTVLAAITKDTITEVVVTYYTDVERGPWGDTTSCKLVAFDINR